MTDESILDTVTATDQVRHLPLDDDVRALADSLLAVVLSIDEACGGYTVKGEARTTGATIYAKFANDVEFPLAMKFYNLMTTGPERIVALLNLLIALDNTARNEQAADDDHPAPSTAQAVAALGLLLEPEGEHALEAVLADADDFPSRPPAPRLRAGLVKHLTTVARWIETLP